MPSSGPNYPTSASQTSTGSPYISWNSISNALSNDLSTATVTGNDQEISEHLLLSGYGFSIPTEATIDGLEVVVGYLFTSMSAFVDLSASFVIDSTPKGGNTWINIENNGNYGTVTYGGPTDKWGTTWTPADINRSDFKTLLYLAFTTPKNATFQIDYVTVKVYYSLGGASSIWHGAMLNVW